jgi:alpha-amylase/alpha-mannosidase (GH57 family)
MVAPYPSYKRLADLFKMLESGSSAALFYLSGQFLADLLTWYHLAWCGESLRREHHLVIALMSKAENFSHADRKALFDLIGKEVSRIIPRYRKLAESGQIEISTTPHYHPLSPLLLEFRSARESEAESSLPQTATYPGGRSRVEAHINSAMITHQQRFGAAPRGVWPAEGAVSSALLEVLAEQGCHWTASGQAVLVNSLNGAGLPAEYREQYLYRPYHVQGLASGVHCFFRDDQLSDAIGFEYASWNGNDAAHHFVARLEEIAQQAAEAGREGNRARSRGEAGREDARVSRTLDAVSELSGDNAGG